MAFNQLAALKWEKKTKSKQKTKQKPDFSNETFNPFAKRLNICVIFYFFYFSNWKSRLLVQKTQNGKVIKKIKFIEKLFSVYTSYEIKVAPMKSVENLLCKLSPTLFSSTCFKIMFAFSTSHQFVCV